MGAGYFIALIVIGVAFPALCSVAVK